MSEQNCVVKCNESRVQLLSEAAQKHVLGFPENQLNSEEAVIPRYVVDRENWLEFTMRKKREIVSE